MDTAGRLHFDEQMMQELQQINQKLLPRYKILVLDAMTGQQSLSIAQTFDQKVGFYASILTKMDSNASAGAALAFRYVLKSLSGSLEREKSCQICKSLFQIVSPNGC